MAYELFDALAPVDIYLFDHRSQGLSDHPKLFRPAQHSWVASFDDYVKDALRFVDEIIQVGKVISLSHGPSLRRLLSLGVVCLLCAVAGRLYIF